MDRLAKLLSDPAFLAINGAVVVLVGTAFLLGWRLARRATLTCRARYPRPPCRPWEHVRRVALEALRELRQVFDVP